MIIELPIKNSGSELRRSINTNYIVYMNILETEPHLNLGKYEINIWTSNDNSDVLPQEIYFETLEKANNFYEKIMEAINKKS